MRHGQELGNVCSKRECRRLKSAVLISVPRALEFKKAPAVEGGLDLDGGHKHIEAKHRPELSFKRLDIRHKSTFVVSFLEHLKHFAWRFDLNVVGGCQTMPQAEKVDELGTEEIEDEVPCC